MTSNSLAGTVLKALADPTRRAIFERLSRDGEQAVHALAEGSDVTRAAISQHLAALKRVGLVRDRRRGHGNRYSAQPEGLASLIEWLNSRAGKKPK
jgi:DNA-binding transcriptional ArsR family regulator